MIFHRNSSCTWISGGVAWLHLFLAVASSVILVTAGGSLGASKNGMMSPQKYSSTTTKEALQRRLMKGREVIPPTNDNVISAEPSCEELRAMWRYYKRQSRAELTNEISRFGTNRFWDIIPASPQNPKISAFGSLQGRGKARMRLKNPKGSVYGRMVNRPDRERDRLRKLRPMEQVAKLMGKSGQSNGEDKAGNGSPKITEPIVHLSPPPATIASGLQKIKEVLREERLRENANAKQNNQNYNNDENSKAFGRIILSPPRGMDGRVANKPRELMTPFEKIRFGHADEILDDENTRPNLNIMSKRRTLPLPMLKMRQRQVLQHRPSKQDFLTLKQPVEWSLGSRRPQILFGEDYNPEEIDPGVDDFGITLENPGIYSSDGFQADRGNWLSFPLETEVILGDNRHRNLGENEPMVMDSDLKIETPDLPSYTNQLQKGGFRRCQEVQGRACRGNLDCGCIGFGLYRCYINQCQFMTLDINSEPVAEESVFDGGDFSGVSSSSSSLWHSQPLDTEDLGVWQESAVESGGLVQKDLSTSSSDFQTASGSGFAEDNGASPNRRKEKKQ